MYSQDLYKTLLEQLEPLPERLGGHIWLSIGALVIGIVVSIPLGIMASRSPKIERVSLGIASLIQTVPSLALLALMVWAWGTIGWIPALIALVLYSILPVLRSTVTGLHGVDSACIEAAQGIGMNERQMLWWVELPLAGPSIIAGIRTATVWVVGLATIAQPVGATSLGNYIFLGLQTSNSAALLTGCIFSALLAISLDRILRGVEEATIERDKARLMRLGAFLLMIILSPLFLGFYKSPAKLAASRQFPADVERSSTRTITIGGKAFTEGYTMAHLLEEALKSNGIETRMRTGMGSTILFEALATGAVDVYVDYTGTIWSTIMKRSESLSPAELFVEVATYLKREHEITVLGQLGFENSYSLAMKRQKAKSLGIASIEDLRAQSSDLVAVSEVEFFGRPEWTHLRTSYGLEFNKKMTMDANLMYDAVHNGKSDVVFAYTTDGRIPAYDLVILEDPRRALPSYDAIILLSKDAVKDMRVERALRPLINAVSTKQMQLFNKAVDLDGATPVEVARRLYTRIAASAEGRENSAY
jgi:osmoprotectant transport system permease protein